MGPSNRASKKEHLLMKQQLKAKKRGREDVAAEASDAASPPRKIRSAKASFFTWLLGLSKSDFFQQYFEKKHFVVSHDSPDKFTKGFPGVVPPVEWSTSHMVQLAKDHPLHYGTDLNVVRFDPELKQRVSYKTEGQVDYRELERCMKEGWSVRFLRPHEFIETNSAFISVMEEQFNCYCGVNSYWTPPNSQGFAPHYDDVDVFLIQLEGEKQWRLYDPLEDVDTLTRHSSEDYQPEQFPVPKHSVTLKAGDVLYMPRGLVHQGKTSEHTHSLHITFSANQMNTWADLFQRSARYSIESLAANHLEWRRALPLELGSVLGEVNHPLLRKATGLLPLTPEQAQHRSHWQMKIREMVAQLTLLMTDEAAIDISADMYYKDTVQKLQPPSRSHHHPATEATVLTPRSLVRLVSHNCLRLVLNKPGEAQVYHNAQNSRVCLAGELGELRFEADFAPAIATLISRYPKATAVQDLPFPGFDSAEDIAENQLLLAEALRDAGVLRYVATVTDPSNRAEQHGAA